MQADSSLEYKGDEGAEAQFSSSRDGSMDSALGLGLEERETSGPQTPAAAPPPFAAPPSLSACPITRMSHAYERAFKAVSSCAALDPCLPLLSLLSTLQLGASAAVSLVGALLLWRGRSLETTVIAGANTAHWSPLPPVNDFLFLGVRMSAFFVVLFSLMRSASIRPIPPAAASAAPTATPMERRGALCIAVPQVVAFGLLMSRYHSLPSLDVVQWAAAAPGVPLSVSAPIAAHLAWCLRFAGVVMHLHTLAVAALLGMTAAVLVRREVFKDLDKSQLCATLCDDIRERLATLPSAGALLSRACTRLCGGVTRDDAINAAPKSKCTFAAFSSATSCPHALPSSAASASAASSSAAASSTAATAAAPMCPFRVATGAAGKMRILTGCVVATMQELALHIQPALEHIIHPQHHPSPAPPVQRTRPGRRPSCIESFLTPVPESALETSTTPVTPAAASATPKQADAAQQSPPASSPPAPVASSAVAATSSSSSTTLPFDLTAASSYPAADSASASAPAESPECATAASSSSSPPDSDDGFVLVDADFASE